MERIQEKNVSLCIDLCSRLLTSLENKANTLFIVQYLLQQLTSKIPPEKVNQLRLLRLGCKVCKERFFSASENFTDKAFILNYTHIYFLAVPVVFTRTYQGRLRSSCGASQPAFRTATYEYEGKNNFFNKEPVFPFVLKSACIPNIVIL